MVDDIDGRQVVRKIGFEFFDDVAESRLGYLTAGLRWYRVIMK